MRFLSILLVLIACFWAMSLNELADSQQKLMAGDSGKRSLAFTQNKGQWPDSVLYRAGTEGAAVWLTTAGIYYQFTRNAQEDVCFEDSTLEPYPLSFVRQQERVDQLLIKASFVGANPEPQALGEEMLRFRCNYFLSGDSCEWRTDVPNYGSVVYRDLYPGIDLRCYGNGRQMEYDYIVSPGADYTQVRLHYDGARSVRINDQSGEFVIETDWGAVTERIAAVYQIIDGERKEIAAKYCSFEDNTLGFKLRDTYNPQVALIIDPVMTYSTFFGGSDDEYGKSIALDQAGNYYITGMTMSSNFPTKNAIQSYLDGDRSAYIAKFSALDGLVYSTYLGSYSYGYDIAVDNSGCAYITGYTYGSIPTANPFQDSYYGSYAAFVTKLNSAGDILVYSTYLAGSDYDNAGDGIAVDSYGSAYVTGYTSSSDFPILNAYDPSYNGETDAFVTKFNPAGNTLAFSTFLGGSSTDGGYDIAVDNSGNVWVTGETYSSNFPTLNAYDGTYNGSQDGFVAKLNSSGNNLLGSTYLGGSGDEAYCCLAVDDAGKAYVTGQTSSSNFPTTGGAFDPTFNGGLDVFVVKFGIDCSNLVYSTYLGGSADDGGFNRIAVDGSGNAHVTGRTKSSNFPLVDAVDPTLGGAEDAFVAEVNSDGSHLLYSTYLGGSGTDVGEGIAVDGSGNVYVTGHTNSSDFPTMNPYDGSYNGAGGTYGYGDVFVTKFSASGNQPPTVEITNPPDYRLYVKAQTSVLVKGIASDPDGTIEEVQVKIDNGSWTHAAGTASWAYIWSISGVTDGKHIIYAKSKDNQGTWSDVDSIIEYVNKIVFVRPFSEYESKIFAHIDFGAWDDHGSFVDGLNAHAMLDAETWGAVFWASGLRLGGQLVAIPEGFGVNTPVSPNDGFWINQSNSGKYKVTYDLQSSGRYSLSTGGYGEHIAFSLVKAQGDVWPTDNSGAIIPVGGPEQALFEYRYYGDDPFGVVLDYCLGLIPIGDLYEALKTIVETVPRNESASWNKPGPLVFRVCLDANTGYVPAFEVHPVASFTFTLGATYAIARATEDVQVNSITIEFESSDCSKEDQRQVLTKVDVRTATSAPTSGTLGIIIVDNEGDGNYTRIQDAVENADPGDRIEVYSGTYYDNILLDKKLTLVGIPNELGVGSDTGAPVLEVSQEIFGKGRGDGILINKDSCIVKGFKIVNSQSAAISLDSASADTISDNTFSNNRFGILLSHSSNGNIFSNNIFEYQLFSIAILNSHNNSFATNKVYKNGAGVLMAGSSNNTFSHNEIGLTCDAFLLANSSNNQFTDNTIDTCFRHGIYLSESFDNVITGNTFITRGISFCDTSMVPGSQTIAGNTLNGKPIYYYANMSGITVPNDAGQVILVNCTNFTIQNLDISDVDCGIQLLSSSGNNISQCSLSDNLYGILLRGSTNNTISNSSFSNNFWGGVFLMDSPSNQLISNTLLDDGITLFGDSISGWNTQTIQGDTINGKPIYYYANMDSVTVPSDAGQVILANCSNFKIQNVNISNVEYGIQLGFSSKNLLSSSNVSKNLCGLVLCSSDSNTTTGNEFDSNSTYGVLVRRGTGNLFWNNSFVKDTVSAYEDTNVTGNFWNFGEVGNKWGDFENNPGYPSEYQIPGPGDGVDHYPFGAFVRGDANGDGVVDISDVVYLLNYLFIHGPAPVPLEAGDATCNGVVDASDLVYLLNYLFAHGPAPSCK